MIKATYRLSVLAATIFLTFVQQAAFAERAPVPVVAARLLGFQLPEVNRTALVEKVEMLRAQLIERKELLTRSLEDKKLDSGDLLISAIMPGGLLYAGYKELQYERAKDELARLNAQIDEFGNDLLAVQDLSVPAAVALAY